MRLIVLALTVASCAAGDAPRPDAGVAGARLELLFQPSGEPSGVALDMASASFEEIRFVGDSGEDVEAGTTSLDLLSKPPAVVVEDATPGLYSRVRLRLGPDDRDTLAVDGVFQGMPVEFRTRAEDEIDLRCPQGRRLDPGGDVTIAVDVDRSGWFAGVELHEAVVEGGVLSLDPDEGPNRDLAETVLQRIEGSFAIHGAPDHDGGHIEDGEGVEDGEGDGHEDDGGGGPDDGGND